MSHFKVLESPSKSLMNASGIYNLLFDHENIQIYHNTIKKGRSMIFSPFESVNSVTVLFILKGKFYYVNEDQIITSHMQIMIKNLDKAHNLIVLEDTEYIQIRENKIMESQLVLLQRASVMIADIEAKDHYTENHCDQTGNLSVAIATLMGLNPKNVQYLLYASKLHDIGKIQIPIEILNKPGRLTKEEFEIIQTHSKIGCDIILKMLDEDRNTMEDSHINIFQNVADIIHQHHEKLDGSGYPNKLTSKTIRIEAKILLVADSFSAMTSDRPYQKAKAIEVAIEELKSYVGIWYDQEVVQTLELFANRFRNYLDK